jgi:hypothetical protein
MAVDAVWSEPVSRRYSLQTGKLTGKSHDLRRLCILNFSDKPQNPLHLWATAVQEKRNKTGNNFNVSGNWISLIRDLNSESPGYFLSRLVAKVTANGHYYIVGGQQLHIGASSDGPVHQGSGV